MVRYLLPLRFLMLLACLWAVFGAILMFGLAGAKLGHAAEALWLGGFGHAKEITSAVMGATDASLFGVVLIIFAYAIAFAFVFQLDSRVRERVPGWMQIENVSELKHALIEVIIVYLVVDFATDLATEDSILAWESLVKPVSVALIAATLRLIAVPQSHETRHQASEPLQAVPPSSSDTAHHSQRSLDR
jgi:uncharacterized membrane protein YqhA